MPFSRYSSLQRCRGTVLTSHIGVLRFKSRSGRLSSGNAGQFQEVFIFICYEKQSGTKLTLSCNVTLLQVTALHNLNLAPYVPFGIKKSDYLYIYIKMNVCLFVCLFVLNGFKNHTSNHRQILGNL